MDLSSFVPDLIGLLSVIAGARLVVSGLATRLLDVAGSAVIFSEPRVDLSTGEVGRGLVTSGFWVDLSAGEVGRGLVISGFFCVSTPG
jgi:hypothetical protein